MRCFLWLCKTPLICRAFIAVKGWRERCAKKACWIEEFWTDWLQWRSLVEPLRDFDYVFVACEATAKPLSEILGRPCIYLPAGSGYYDLLPLSEPAGAPH